MPKISIVIPVHNSEKTLDKCISSITEQTYSDIEVLLIENASTDGSVAKCREWCEKDKRVKLFTIDGASISKARNAGLDRITGEYYAFVDSDDYVSESMYEKLLNKAAETGADMVCCRIYNVYPDGSVKESKEKNLSKLFCGREIQHWYASGDEYVRRPIWRSLYRTEVLGKIRFNEQMSFKEDICYLNECYLKAKKIEVVDEPLYYYSQNYGIANFYVKKYYSKNFIYTLKLVIKNSDSMLEQFAREDLRAIFRYETLCLAVSAIVINEKHYRQKLRELYRDEFWREVADSSNFRVYFASKGLKDKVKSFLVRYKLYFCLKVLRKIKL